jgi:CarD family transcriptional regulator
MRDYLEIELVRERLRILVPCDATAAVGLRPVVGLRRLREIVEVLEGTPDAFNANWPARQKRYRERLQGGDVLELAAVIRDLAVRSEASPLSTTERALYERSREVLASELRYALGVDAEHASAYIAQHIDGGTIAEAAPAPKRTSPAADATPEERR